MGMVEIRRALMTTKRGKQIPGGHLKGLGCTEEDLRVCVDNGWLIEIPADENDTMWHEKNYMLTEEGFRIVWD